MHGILAVGLSLALLTTAPARADGTPMIEISPGDRPLELTALSTITGSITHTPLHLAGDIGTGSVVLSGLDAAGGVTVAQIATGAGNLQQSSLSLAIVLSGTEQAPAR